MKRIGSNALCVCAGSLVMFAVMLGGCTDLQGGTEPSGVTSTVAGVVEGSTTTSTVAVAEATTTATSKQATATTVKTAISLSVATLDPDMFALATTTLPPAVASTRYEENDSHLLWFGPWSQYSASGVSGGGYRVSSSYAWVQVKFEGTRIDFCAITSWKNGTARLLLDGSEYMVNLNAALFNTVVVWTSPVLSYGVHTLRIEQTDVANPGPSGYNYISFDAVDVLGKLVNP